MAESISEMCARLEAECERAERATTNNGRLEIHAAELRRLFAIFRSYGGRSDWMASDQNVAMLAAPVRRYIDELLAEVMRLQKANAAQHAANYPLPANVEALIDTVAAEIDYASFIVSAPASSKMDRRRARDKARSILQMLQRRKCLVSFEAPDR